MIFGLVCKGLHCAGCGKGIPAGIVIILLGVVFRLASQVSNTMVHELASAIMWGAFVVGGCVVATGTSIALLQRRDFQMMYTNWEGPTTVQEKVQEDTWTKQAQLDAPNPFYMPQDTAP